MTPTSYDTQDALCTFQCQGLDAQTFLVAQWRGEEALSRPYRFEVELASAVPDLALESLLGQRATLSTRAADGNLLPWHGIITDVMQTGMDDGYARYQVVLEPQFSLLRHLRASRVYVDTDRASQPLPDLGYLIRRTLRLCQLTDAAPVGAAPDPDAPSPHYAVLVSDADLALTQTSFICQFEETSLDFLSRRLEQEGVYYWFEQRHDREVIVFGNALSHQPRQPVALTWRPTGTLDPELTQAAVSRFDTHISAQPGRVTLRDFAASRAHMDLTVQQEVRDDDDSTNQDASRNFGLWGDYAIYAEHYDRQQRGEQIALLRSQEIACRRKRFRGVARAPALQAGMLARLHGHFRDDINADYYVIEATHAGSQPLPAAHQGASTDGARYETQFVALPADVQFRPERATPRPRVIGYVSALIDAEGDGEYAELNANGCYKVRFPFSAAKRDDGGNSAWIRMATPYAGDGHGMHLPLLKGTEVMIAFISGDPDRPIIAAAVPNSENPSVVRQNNATQAGLRTLGGNRLAFEDRKGTQAVLLSSPTASSSIVLGGNSAQPNAHGVGISSDNHMGMASGSYSHVVPNVYRLTIGSASGGSGGGDDASPAGGTPTEPPTPPTPPKDDTKPDEPADDKKDDKKEESKPTQMFEEKTGHLGALPWSAGGSWGAVNEFFIGNKFGASLAATEEIYVGLKGEINIAATAGFVFSKGVEFNFFERRETNKKKEEDNLSSTINTADRTENYGKQTVTVLAKKSETAFDYSMSATGSATLEGQGTATVNAFGTSLTLDGKKQTATLGGKMVNVAGTVRTIVGDSSPITKVMGKSMTIGDNTTTSLTINATEMSFTALATGNVRSRGQLVVDATGVVRIG